ncbi:MAG: BMP family ABC transporter substrate-binding protein [Spirochaetales bacterium]|nr:BMP family ABC transporter substrate-binding protein [Spirochaetales bacterium]
MKKTIISILVMVLLISTLIVTGCKKDEAADDTAKTVSEEPVKVVLYLNGTLGDKSFFDSASDGIKKAGTELGIKAKVIEGGYDASRWEPDLTQLCEGDWDIIVAGTWQTQEILEKLAPLNPDKKFFTYDTSVSYDKGGLDNVYSILYLQNEASFLVGALGAMITTSDMPQANAKKSIGFLGGMDIDVINDFKIGYVEGAAYIDPAVDVKVAYAGAWNDPAKGKELTLAFFDQGADISFNVAGETGLGGLDAAKERNKYTFGVDSDQYALYAVSDPKKAANIVTSMLKNVGASLYRGIKMHQEGTLVYGQAEFLGIAEGGVGIAKNENYTKLVPADFQKKIEEIEIKILNKEIKVSTAF